MYEDTDVKMYIQIEVQSEEEKKTIGMKIHEQLDCNIILNIDEPYMIRLWVFKECESVPQITI